MSSGFIDCRNRDLALRSSVRRNPTRRNEQYKSTAENLTCYVRTVLAGSGTDMRFTLTILKKKYELTLACVRTFQISIEEASFKTQFNVVLNRSFLNYNRDIGVANCLL